MDMDRDKIFSTYLGIQRLSAYELNLHRCQINIYSIVLFTYLLRKAKVLM